MRKFFQARREDEADYTADNQEDRVEGNNFNGIEPLSDRAEQIENYGELEQAQSMASNLENLQPVLEEGERQVYMHTLMLLYRIWYAGRRRRLRVCQWTQGRPPEERYEALPTPTVSMAAALHPLSLQEILSEVWLYIKYLTTILIWIHAHVHHNTS